MKNKTILVFENHEKLSEAAAHCFVTDANRAIAKRGFFTIALSGSSTPQRFHQLLASPEFSQNIPWEKVFFFFGDERHVSQNSEENNFNMAHENLLRHIKVPQNNIFPIPTGNDPKKDAVAYEKTIRKFFKRKSPRFDWVVMGLGTNGHTASLFPFSPVLKEYKRWVVDAVNSDTGQPRITFTYPLINAARQVIFLVSGREKAAMVKEALQGNQPKKIIPVHGVMPNKGVLTWMLDREAASLLKGSHGLGTTNT